MTTIQGDFNHVTAEGHFLGDVRMADGDVKPGSVVIIEDLFGEGRKQGIVTEVTPDGQVVVDIRFVVEFSSNGNLILSDNGFADGGMFADQTTFAAQSAGGVRISQLA